MSAKLEEFSLGSVDMGTVSMVGSAYNKNVTTDGVAETKWYVIGTLKAEGSFDIAALGRGSDVLSSAGAVFVTSLTY